MDTNFTDPDGFCSATEFVDSLKSYAKTFELPVLENSRIISVEKLPTTDMFSITIKHKADTVNHRCKILVIASGIQNIKSIPSISSNISKEIFQLHASEYRNSNMLPQGNVLVVGSGQSGVQITEDLVDNGRKVYLSTSMVARAPRRYRGKDIFEWMNIVGFNDHRPTDLPDPQMLKMKQPQISGVGRRGKTVSLQALAKKGVIILGKIDAVNQNHIDILANAMDHVKFGDAFSNTVKTMIDDYIEKAGVDAPLPEIDPADLPDENAECVSDETSINLKENNITTIIWATGFKGDFGYFKLPVFSSEGTLKHKEGVAEIEGLYFLGFPWLRKRKSGIVYGINEDAKFISEKINEAL
jgi:putative flavoprotein involved in K+ transport